MHKRITSVILAASVAFMTAACSGTGAVTSSLPADHPADAEISAEESGTTGTESEPELPGEGPAPEEAPADSAAAAVADEVPDGVTKAGDTLYDADGIQITYEGMEEEAGYKDVLLTIANRSGRSITLTADMGWTDSCMQECVLYEDIKAGAVVHAKALLGKDMLSYTGVDGFTELGILLHAMDSETFDRLEIRYPMVIRFSDMEPVGGGDDVSGTPVYDKGGITIVPKGTGQRLSGGYDILYYISNNSGTDISVTAGDFIVNGKKTDMFARSIVTAGHRAVMAARIFSPVFGEDPEFSVGSTQCSFTVRDAGTFSNIGKAENVTADFGALPVFDNRKAQTAQSTSYHFASLEIDSSGSLPLYRTYPMNVADEKTVVRNGKTLGDLLDYVDNEVLEEGRRINRPLFFDLFETTFIDDSALSSVQEDVFELWMSLCLSMANEFRSVNVRVTSREEGSGSSVYKFGISGYDNEDTWILTLSETPLAGGNMFYLGNGNTEYHSSMLDSDTLMMWLYVTESVFSGT